VEPRHKNKSGHSDSANDNRDNWLDIFYALPGKPKKEAIRLTSAGPSCRQVFRLPYKDAFALCLLEDRERRRQNVNLENKKW
jgi:hypothetical protein